MFYNLQGHIFGELIVLRPDEVTSCDDELPTFSAPIGPASPVAFPAFVDPKEGKEDKKVKITEKGIDERKDQKIVVGKLFCDHGELVATPLKN